MKRICITVDDDTLTNLDKYVKTFFLEDPGNRSGYIVGLIRKNTPIVPE